MFEDGHHFTIVRIDQESASREIEYGELERRENQGRIPLFFRYTQGLMTQCGRVWVLVVGRVRQTLLEEEHKSKFSIHPGATKMYRDLRLSY